MLDLAHAPDVDERRTFAESSIKSRMETIEAYLERKHREIGLLNDCLRSPRQVPCPRSVDEVINVIRNAL